MTPRPRAALVAATLAALASACAHVGPGAPSHLDQWDAEEAAFRSIIALAPDRLWCLSRAELERHTYQGHTFEDGVLIVPAMPSLMMRRFLTDSRVLSEDECELRYERGAGIEWDGSHYFPFAVTLEPGVWSGPNHVTFQANTGPEINGNCIFDITVERTGSGWKATPRGRFPDASYESPAGCPVVRMAPDEEQETLLALLEPVVQLPHLSLQDTPVDDALALELAARWPLESLNLSATRVTNEVLAELRARYPGLRLWPRVPR